MPVTWIDKLKTRWKVENTAQVILILVVFALTGTTVAYIMKPLLQWLFEPNEIPTWAKIVYYVLILPIYNLLLLLYGLLLGQFQFFWNFEKKFFSRLFSRFSR